MRSIWSATCTAALLLFCGCGGPVSDIDEKLLRGGLNSGAGGRVIEGTFALGSARSDESVLGGEAHYIFTEVMGRPQTESDKTQSIKNFLKGWLARNSISGRRVREINWTDTYDHRDEIQFAVSADGSARYEVKVYW